MHQAPRRDDFSRRDESPRPRLRCRQRSTADRSRRTQNPNQSHKRIHIQLRWAANGAQSLSTVQWRPVRTRLFNNVAISLKNGEEADEYVQSIGEQIRVTVLLTGREINVGNVARLDTGSSPTSIARKMTSVFRLRPSSASAGSKNEAPKNFNDEMATNKSSNLLEVLPSLTPSRSDGVLSERGSSLAGKLHHKLLYPKSRPSAAPQQDPFQSYSERIRASKSLIMML